MRPEQIPGTLFVILLAWTLSRYPGTEPVMFLLVLALALSWLAFTSHYAWYGAIFLYVIVLTLLGYRIFS